MARRQLSTGDYPDPARVRLGRAVEAARIAAGYRTRTAFIAKAGISMRSLKYVEQGNRGVGPKVLNPIATYLPGWTEDTPRHILEGGEPPEPSIKPQPQEQVQPEMTPDEKREALVEIFALMATYEPERLEAVRRKWRQVVAEIPDDRLSTVLSDNTDE